MLPLLGHTVAHFTYR